MFECLLYHEHNEILDMGQGLGNKERLSIYCNISTDEPGFAILLI